MKKIILIIVGLFIIGFGLFTLLQNSSTEQEQISESEQVSKIEISENKIDFGDILQSDGIVETTVTVKNIGDANLVLNRLSTSCGCTTADMDMADILPGEKREMQISFDPMVHADQFGPIIRAVYLQTNDPVMPEIEIEINGNVIK